MKDVQINVDGHLFQCFESGDNALPTLVCLHGMTNESRSFGELIPLLNKHFHMLLIDGPGHGGTAAFSSEDDYLFPAFTRKLMHAIEQITTRPFYIMGHSWGADIALHLAKYFPNKVKGLVLIDGGYIFPEYFDATEEQTLRSWKQFIEGSRYGSWADVRNDFQVYTTQKWRDSLDEAIVHSLVKEEGEYILKADVFSVLSAMKAMYKEPCSTTFDAIQCPVLLFHGTEGMEIETREKALRAIKEKITAITIVGLSNTQHYPHWDFPADFSNELRTWYEKM